MTFGGRDIREEKVPAGSGLPNHDRDDGGGGGVVCFCLSEMLSSRSCDSGLTRGPLCCVVFKLQEGRCSRFLSNDCSVLGGA